MKPVGMVQPAGTVKPARARCLILACGNTLRSDDGVGPWLAAWAQERFDPQAGVSVISRQQWTPELAEDVASVETVLFVDCAMDLEPGTVKLVDVEPADGTQGLATHHLGAAELLGLARALFGSLPRRALMLTVGGGSTELGELFSPPVTAALPIASAKMEDAVARLMRGE